MGIVNVAFTPPYKNTHCTENRCSFVRNVFWLAAVECGVDDEEGGNVIDGGLPPAWMRAEVRGVAEAERIGVVAEACLVVGTAWEDGGGDGSSSNCPSIVAAAVVVDADVSARTWTCRGLRLGGTPTPSGDWGVGTV